MGPFDALDRASVARCLYLSHPPSGLRAIVVIDDVTLGPAAGGVRTRRYATEDEALSDAAALARAMTWKCALAGLDAGGGKAVVLEHPGLDREAAFEQLGRYVEELGGLLRTAGDLGTTDADLAAMARATRYVHTDDGTLLDAVGRGLRRCVEACAERLRGDGRLDGLRVAIQGCGAVGGAAARALHAAGATLLLSDVDEARAERLAHELSADTCPATRILLAEADVLAPCAAGGAVTGAVAARLRVRAVCGAANNILEATASEVLRARGILHVPDVIASAGAVIAGIGRSVMGLPDTTPLVDRLGATAGAVLDEAAHSGRTPDEVAVALARTRLDQRRAELRSARTNPRSPR